MGRYRGTLHKLVEQGPLKKGNWNLVLNYLEGHAVGNRNAENPSFVSPLPNLTAASPDLERELLCPQGPKQDETPLRIATLCKSCPSQVLAALCHLGPEAARLSDGKSRRRWPHPSPRRRDTPRTTPFACPRLMRRGGTPAPFACQYLRL